MCLTIVPGAKPKEAKKPIICYKVGRRLSNGRFLTKSQDYRYCLGVIQDKLKIGIEADKNIYAWPRMIHPVDELYLGYHSLNSYFQGWKYPFKLSDIIGLFIIPKGSTYYDGIMNGDSDHPNRVSDQIVWLGSPWSPLTWLRVLKYFIVTE